MKRNLLLLAMSVLFAIGLTSMVQVEPYPFCQEDCAFLVEEGIFPTQGACMSACHSCTSEADFNAATFAVCFCKTAGPFEGDPLLGQKNFGKCVNLVKGHF